MNYTVALHFAVISVCAVLWHILAIACGHLQAVGTKLKSRCTAVCATHFKIYHLDPRGFPWSTVWLLNDKIPRFSQHHPDVEPMEACEQKLPVIQYFDVLPQTCEQVVALYWGLTVLYIEYVQM